MEKEMKLLFQVKPTSGVPIYRQIIDQVNRLVSSGYLKSGDELPSVRQVAEYLEVNQMTISKAYSLLKATGVLERHSGKPMMVAKRRGRSKSVDKRLDMIWPVLNDVVTQARQLALTKDEVINELNSLMWEEEWKTR